MKKLFLILMVAFVGVVTLNKLGISPVTSAYAYENETLKGTVTLIAAMSGASDLTGYIYVYKEGGVDKYFVKYRPTDLMGSTVYWENNTYNGTKYNGRIGMSGITYYFNYKR